MRIAHQANSDPRRATTTPHTKAAKAAIAATIGMLGYPFLERWD
jgi:hypothetical protein